MNPIYAIALNQALTWIKANYEPTGIIVSGSIVRGNPDKHSDLDIYVIHHLPFKQRVQKFFNGVACEIFINNIEHIYQYFESELNANRPVTANILSTGQIFLGAQNEQIITLIAEAGKYASALPVLTGQQLLLRKYALANLFEDATDLLNSDPSTALYILDKVVIEAVELTFVMNLQTLPRIKERFKLLRTLQPLLSDLMERYYAAGSIDWKYHIAKEIVSNLTGETGFFEWESERS